MRIPLLKGIRHNRRVAEELLEFDNSQFGSKINMITVYPQRHYSHILENKSDNYLRSRLPQDWIVNRPNNDYGYDFQIEIVTDGKVTGQELLIQLKASQKVSRTSAYESIRLETSTYNYLASKLAVVMLVKYVGVEDDAYWILLRDIPKPNPKFKSFTVRITKENRISTVNWINVVKNVERITARKLNAVT